MVRVLQIKVKTFSQNLAEQKASLAHTLLRHWLMSSSFNFWTWSDAPSTSRIFKVSPLYKLNNKVRMMTELQTIKYDPNDSFYTLTRALMCLIDIYLSRNWSLWTWLIRCEHTFMSNYLKLINQNSKYRRKSIICVRTPQSNYIFISPQHINFIRMLYD